MKLQRVDIIAASFFVLIVGVFFRQTLFEGKLPVPADALVGLYHPWRDFYSNDFPRGVPFKNFLITDPVRQQIPWRKIVIDQWKQGQIPLWNPYNFSGAPLLGNIQAAVFYPLNIVFFLFPFIEAWTVLVMLQPMLAGLFMYWYLRSLNLHPSACLLGAVTWSFSGFNIAWMTWGTIGHVALWLPLALLSIDKLLVWMSFPPRDEARGKLQRESIFRSLKAGSPIRSGMTRRMILLWSIVFLVSSVSQFFAGHAQISLYFILLVITYGVIRVVQAKDKTYALCILGILLTSTAILTAIQWIPLLNGILQSSRVIDGSDWHKEGWFIPWAHLVQFVAPDFFGNPTTLNYWGQWNYGEFIGYIGVLPLVFVFIAILSRSLKACRFWISSTAISLLFALPTPIAYLPFMLKVPVLSSLQPTRLLFIVDFALAILVAYGCHQWLDKSFSRVRKSLLGALLMIGAVIVLLWSIVVASRFGLFDPSLQGPLEVSMRNLVVPTILFMTAAVMLIMYQRVSRAAQVSTILAWSFVGLAAVDVFRFGWKFTPFTPREDFFPETKIITFLKEQEKPLRVMSVDKRILPPNTASYFGIESIEGYDPIISSRYEELVAAIARGVPDIRPPFGFNRIVTLESLSSPLFPLLNARYILSLSELSDQHLTNVFKEGETRIYEDSRALPRVYVVERPIMAFGKESTIKELYAMRDVRLEAVVEGNISILSVPMVSDESVYLTRYESNRLEIETKLSVPRLLVVVNAYDSGWRATIDGKSTRIYKTNYAFQGVIVPEGTHKVVFSYSL